MKFHNGNIIEDGDAIQAIAAFYVRINSICSAYFFVTLESAFILAD
jgi:hypothetical protein